MYKMGRPTLGEPLQFSVTVAHRWRHFQYIVFNVSDIRLFTKTVSVELRCLLNKTFAVE